jgi:hypothetical protein
MSYQFDSFPYFDDYNENKKFHKILFRPGFAVQTRELNQIQTLLQKQIDRFGKGIYKEGAMVIPGGLSYRTDFNFIKISSIISSVIFDSGNEQFSSELTLRADIENAIKSFVGRRIFDRNSNISGIVKWYHLGNETDQFALYVEYDSSNTTLETNSSEFFFSSDTELFISSLEDSNISKDDFSGYKITTLDSVDYKGTGSIAEIQRGVYFVKGNFVMVEPQIIVLEPYASISDCSIGLKVIESIVTPESDLSLTDNANGTFNFTAPGAHRYSIDLRLEKRDLDSDDVLDFFELFRIKNERVESHIVKTEYSEISKELARRTYDESGDYIVSGFRVNVKESRNNNRGEWTSGTSYKVNDVVTVTTTTITEETSITEIKYYVAKNDGVSGGTPPSGSTTFLDGGITWLFDLNPFFNNGHSLDGDNEKLIISVEPGKAYVRGFEVEKISSNFIEIDKSREFSEVDNDLISTNIGNYVKVKTIKGVPQFLNYDSVNLTDSGGLIIGKARIRGLEKYDSPSVYKLYIIDLNINPGKDFSRDAKKITSSLFSCDIANAINQFSDGSVTLSSPNKINGTGTDFQNDFKVGDYIEISGTNFIISQIDSSNVITYTGNDQSSLFQSTYRYKIFRTKTFEPSRLLSIFPLSKNFIRNIKNQLDQSDTTYTVTGSFSNTISSNSPTLTVGPITNGKIPPNIQKNQVIICKSSGGDIIENFGIGNVTTNSFILNFSPLLAQGTYTIFFPVIKDQVNANAKVKTLRTHQITDITEKAIFSSRVLSVRKADVYKIRQILMAPSEGQITNDTNLVDVTGYYDFDNGQRDTHYDVSTIIRKSNYGIPTGSIRIIFDFFEHSDGDYFSVDSYVSFPRENIPTYSSEITGLSYNLADVLDFRPRIGDDGQSFTSTGGKLTGLPKVGSLTRVDYTYYLGRMDILSFDINGQFLISKGTSSEIPHPPESPDLCMNLSTITLNPYTFSSQDVLIEKIDNRRYTMRDIGSLENRINNLEYYTSLSLLEQRANSLQIPDEFGLNRFKNGFIVDNFTSHLVSDSASSEFRASIDPSEKELRPSFIMNNINMIEKSSGNYKINNDVITLNYDEEEGFISQLFASTPENINPFAVFTFIGQVNLNPPSDEWIDTTRLPNVINDVEGNFSEVLRNAQEAGILGTQWNAWETEWAGTSTVSRWGSRVRRGGIPLIQTTIQDQRLVRTGLSTSVSATFSTELVRDRIVSSSVIPWIRSRHLVFLARNLRLNTIVYPFFDNVNISQFITPASRIVFKSLSSQNSINLFDFESNSLQNSEQIARRFNGNVQSAYNKGDVIYLSRRGNSTYQSADTSPSTAICVLQEVEEGSETRSVLIVNVRGTFTTGDIIKGSISGSEGEVVSFDVKVMGDNLITNFSGDVAGVFDIPNNESARFSTGNREFKLIDNIQNDDRTARTRAFGNYQAEGVLQSWQSTFNSVRNGEITRSRISQTQNRRLTIREEQIGWVDPLAQTFLIENRGGVFVTSIDIWFASIDQVKPVTLQIRDVVNGYPGKAILPFSNVTLQPYQLRSQNQPSGFGLSTGTVEVDGGIYLKPDTPTRFKMHAPVYLQDLGEYCIVLLSDSNNYHVWTSQLGAIDISSPTPKIISEQPYAGVLFKSQNASTWTADQNSDLKFRINVANFANQGSIDFFNSRLEDIELEENSIFTRSGSKLIRVFCPNHGHVIGSKVTFTNLKIDVPINGISISDLNNRQLDVLHFDQDSFVVRTNTPAIITGRTGNAGIKISRNIKYDILHPIVQTQNFSDTSMEFEVKPTTSASINGNESAFFMGSNFVKIIPNENNEFFNVKMVCSPENETTKLNNSKSLQVKVTMKTGNPYLSPVIDNSRFSMIAINNRIDFQIPPDELSSGTSNYVGGSGDGDFDYFEIIKDKSFTLNQNVISTNEDEIKNVVKSLIPGKFITIIRGNSTPNIFSKIVSLSSDGSQIFLDRNIVESQSTETITIKIFDNYVDETSFAGSAISKYLTKKIDLSGSTGFSRNLNIRFVADVSPLSEIDVYYKISTVDSLIPFRDISWEYIGSQTPTNGKQEAQFNRTDLTPFNTASVKLVLKSKSSTNIPRVSDLMIIATA